MPRSLTSPPVHTLVVGSGMAGLLCAWHLQRRGASVRVWEAGDRPGGWVHTRAWKGLQVEHGPQALSLQPGDAVDRLVRTLQLPFEPIPRRQRWVGLDGRLIPVPAHGGSFLVSPLLSLRGRIRLLGGLLGGSSAVAGESMEAWARRRFGSEVTERLLPVITHGLFATAPSALDPGALPQRKRSSSFTFPGGMGQLPAALAASLDLRLHHRATSLSRLPDGRWRVATQADEVVTDQVVLALPAFEAAELLASLAPAAAETLREIPYASVDVWHSRHSPLEPFASGHGFLVHPAEGCCLLGCTVASRNPMHLRSFLPQGNQPWEVVDAALRRWLPGLPPAEARLKAQAPRAIAAPAPGHRARLVRIQASLPEGLDWVASARFGQGLGALIAGVTALFGE